MSSSFVYSRVFGGSTTQVWISLVGRPMLDDAVRDYKTSLYALLGATGGVLLIACVNVASLLIARVARKWLSARLYAADVGVYSASGCQTVPVSTGRSPAPWRESRMALCFQGGSVPHFLSFSTLSDIRDNVASARCLFSAPRRLYWCPR